MLFLFVYSDNFVAITGTYMLISEMLLSELKFFMHLYLY